MNKFLPGDLCTLRNNNKLDSIGVFSCSVDEIVDDVYAGEICIVVSSNVKRPYTTEKTREMIAIIANGSLYYSHRDYFQPLV